MHCSNSYGNPMSFSKEVHVKELGEITASRWGVYSWI